MKFIKENITKYIQRIATDNNNDPSNRKITEVHLSPQEWEELTKNTHLRSGCDTVRIALPSPINHKTLTSASFSYQYVEARLDPTVKQYLGDF